jgi:hydrogenase expression/formation protein HypC
MCLGIPGKLTEIYQANGLTMGKIDFGGVVKEVCLAYVPDIQIGDYAIIHVGFAISQIDAEEAAQTLALLHELDMVSGELPELGANEGTS